MPFTAPARMTRPALFLLAFALLALVLAIAGIALGPVPLGLHEVLAALLGQADPRAQAIVAEIRAPASPSPPPSAPASPSRGTTLQGVLRNPLADPGLIGVTAGAALGAVSSIVLAATVFGAVPPPLRRGSCRRRPSPAPSPPPPSSSPSPAAAAPPTPRRSSSPASRSTPSPSPSSACSPT